MNKKAVSLPLNTIIIATIVIIVLIVVVLFFTGKFGQSRDALNNCQAKGGELSNSAACEGIENSVPTPTGSDIDGEQYCCIKLGSD